VNNTGIIAGWLSALILRHIKGLRETYTRPLPNYLSLRTEFVAALRAHISETHCNSCSMSYAADGEALRDQLLHRALRARENEPFHLDAVASSTPVDLPVDSGNMNTS